MAADHCVKVRGLILDLTARIKNDPKAEASQKSSCNNEMASTTLNRDSANAKIAADTASFNKLNTGIQPTIGATETRESSQAPGLQSMRPCQIRR